jgi:hypothetical protein
VYDEQNFLLEKIVEDENKKSWIGKGSINLSIFYLKEEFPEYKHANYYCFFDLWILP